MPTRSGLSTIDKLSPNLLFPGFSFLQFFPALLYPSPQRDPIKLAFSHQPVLLAGYVQPSGIAVHALDPQCHAPHFLLPGQIEVSRFTNHQVFLTSLGFTAHCQVICHDAG
jgi:hypothetical protein